MMDYKNRVGDIFWDIDHVNPRTRKDEYVHVNTKSKVTESDILWDHSYGHKFLTDSFVYFDTIDDAKNVLLSMMDICQNHSGVIRLSQINASADGKHLFNADKNFLEMLGYTWNDIIHGWHIVKLHVNNPFTDAKPIYIIGTSRKPHHVNFCGHEVSPEEFNSECQKLIERKDFYATDKSVVQQNHRFQYEVLW